MVLAQLATSCPFGPDPAGRSRSFRPVGRPGPEADTESQSNLPVSVVRYSVTEYWPMMRPESGV